MGEGRKKNDVLQQVLQMLIEMSIEVEKVKNSQTQFIRQEIDRQFGERIKYVDDILAEVIVEKEVLYDEGLITRQKMTKKLNDMRSAAKNV